MEDKSTRPEDRYGIVPTVDLAGKRRWIYPDRRSGPRASTRRTIAIVLMAIYLVTPFLTWGGHPLLRLSFQESTVYAFGLVLRFSDMSYLAFILLGLALTLFFVTALKGRIWCGYACPQTVFVEWLIRPIEEFIEGSAHHRRIEDQKPLTAKRLSKKVLKQSIFLLISAVVANVLLAYFISPRELVRWMTSPPTQQPTAFIAMVSVMGAVYFDLSWFREQFCSFICPYARFQSVMMDNQTPAVAYDVRRGEPRGKRGQVGDCIDCRLCVRVCPTGIDIRDGLQLECIQCNRCADACDTVMTNLERPIGLIREASFDELEGRTSKPYWQRPRVLIYTLALLVTLGAFSARLLTREKVEFKFSRQSGAAFSTLPDGRLANLFNLRLINNGSERVPLDFQTKAGAADTIICGACAKPLEPYERRDLSLVLVRANGTDGVGEDVFVLRHQATGESYELSFLAPKAP